MKNSRLKFIVFNAIIAALYAALTVALAPISYGGIQFRFSEALMLLPIYNSNYIVGLIIGCFVSNCFSPLGLTDVIFGTIATAIAVIPMLKVKNKYIGSLFVVLSNAIIVGLELYIVFDLPFLLSAAEVALGEFLCVTIIGSALFSSIESNETLIELLVFDQDVINKNINKNFNGQKAITFALGVIMIIFYLSLPVYKDLMFINVIIDEGKYYFLSTIIIIIMMWICMNYFKNKIGYIFSIIFTFINIAFMIVLAAIYNNVFLYIYYYLYLFICLIYLFIAYFNIKKNKCTSLF